MKREGYLRDRYVFNSHQTHKQTYSVIYTVEASQINTAYC